MQLVGAHALRTQLLTAALAAACASGAPQGPAGRDAAGRALEYLRTTRDEAGVDVAVAVQIYREQTGDPRADAAFEALRARLRGGDVERFAALLRAPKPPFPAGSVPPPLPRGTSPVADEDDDRTRSCLPEALACQISDDCRAFARREASGSVLTHQAAWLLFARWAGCPLDLDADALRARYAAGLLAELRAEPHPSDLFFERLAVLGSLGFGRAIERQWLDALLASQRPEGCFPANESTPCHPHPTALALWALGHADPAR